MMDLTKQGRANVTICMIAVSDKTLAKFYEVKEMAAKGEALKDNDFLMMLLRVAYLKIRETESQIRAAEAAARVGAERTRGMPYNQPQPKWGRYHGLGRDQ